MNVLEIIAELKKNRVVPKLVEDQLKLTGETRNLSPELIERVRAAKAELVAFLGESMDRLAYSPIPLAPAGDDYPVSHAQKRIWVLCQFDGATAAYNIVRCFYLRGVVRRRELERSFGAIIDRHESLRTVFIEKDGEPRQVILPAMPFVIDEADLRGRSDIRAILRREEQAAFDQRFDLEKGPLLRVGLFRLADAEYAMFFSIHHIISDGWSTAILVREVMLQYEAYCTDRPFALPMLPVQYKDYCQWSETRAEHVKGAKARDFWKMQFIGAAGADETAGPPADLPRPDRPSFRGAIAKFYFPVGLHAGIAEFCRKQQVTIFNFYRATLSMLLARFAGQEQVVIGTPVAGRNHSDLEGQIGLFVNTLPMGIRIDWQEPFHGLLKRVAAHSLRAFEHQDHPFDKIVEDAQAPREAGRNPLFDVMLVLQHSAMGSGDAGMYRQYGFEMSLLDEYLYGGEERHDKAIPVKLDLTFNFDCEPEERYYLEIEYSTNLYTPERIRGLYDVFVHFIRQAIDNVGLPAGLFRLAGEAERALILHSFNRPVAGTAETSITQLLRGSMEQHADRPALFCGAVELTYKALAEKSGTIAAWLAQYAGTGHPLSVGLLLERSEWMIITILGILEAGAAYIPIDRNYPPERVAYIIGDAQPQMIIAEKHTAGLIPEDYSGRIVTIDELRALPLSPVALSAGGEDLRERTAYTIYTSGSTGVPKGVEIRHRNTIAFLKWMQQEFAATRFDIVYATTSYCFDLSIFEFFFPLIRGKSIRLLGSAMDIPEQLAKDRGVLINTVPSVVAGLLQTGVDWSRVSALNMAGEAVPAGFRQLLNWQDIEVRNLYGPTEDTTYSTVYRFADDGRTTIPIGRPGDYRQLYILDQHLDLLPQGVPGEIYISGHTVAGGYSGKPELTAQRFLENPFLPGTRMYRTGDIGKWLADGHIEFLGRADDQIKIRGHRIEPGEIRVVLEGHPLVHQAAVIPTYPEGEVCLTAYWVGEEDVTAAVLREYLGARLPGYMVPVCWMRLDQLPLNHNGKLDKKRLPVPERGANSRRENRMGRSELAEGGDAVALTPTGLRLAGLWKEVLGDIGLRAGDDFFALGGHSLKAVQLRALIAKRLGKVLTVNEIFAHPTIAAQAHILDSRPKQTMDPIVRIPEHSWYPISVAQERLWVVINFEAASRAYIMPAAFFIEGPLVLPLLEAAFRRVIDRHEILRTVFGEREGQPAQIVLSPDEVVFELEEIRLERPLTVGEEQEYIRRRWQRPFDLSRGPLIDCFLLHAGSRRVLGVAMHHLISDGWSVGVLRQEVMTEYQLLLDGRKEGRPALEIQYRDFSVWQRSRLNAGLLDTHRAFWINMFAGGVPVLELPTDMPRPEIKTYAGAVAGFSPDPLLAQDLGLLARQHGATLFMTLFTGLTLLLKKYANQNDIVIGIPVAGRDHPQLHEQMGYYVNTLAIRTLIDSEESFATLLSRQRDLLLQAFDYQDYPLELLIRELGVKRDLSRSPLFDVMMVFQDGSAATAGGRKELAGGLTLTPLEPAAETAKYDLTFTFTADDQGLSLDLEYNTDLFRPETIDRMAGHLTRLLQEAAAAPEGQVRDIQPMTEEEQTQLLSGADRTGVGYDRDATIVSLFEQAAARFPDRPAVRDGNRTITYAELDRQSGQLADRLMREYGVKRGDLVLLHFERSAWMITAIMGVLRAGGAYVPIDPSYPAARIGYIIEDTGSRLLLFDQPPAAAISDVYTQLSLCGITTLEYTGKGAVAAVEPGDPAYIIYTSGTTGNPKGVILEHRNVVRLLFNEENLFDFNESDSWSLFHSYCFDFSVWEMYGSLLYGGRLVIVPADIARNSLAFFDLLAAEQITVLNQTPSAFRGLVQNNQPRFAAVPLAVRYLIFGGEALRPELLRTWHQAYPGCRNINMYGITETTVHVTYKQIMEKEIADNRSNIGVPIPTLSCYVLDMDLRPALPGVVGELCVGGAGVARGYLNKPELTAARFIDDPVKGEGRLYRSGDFARLLPSGDIEYLGRKDEQVKIRGYRIETGEIETAIGALPGIRDVVVLAFKETGDEYALAAYYIAAEVWDQRELASRLRDTLPAYMLPSWFIRLEAFPVNRNGKLDRDALPRPEKSFLRQGGHVACRNETDQKIVAIWESVLEREGIGIRDNFFDLGGHSLKATRVISRIHEEFGLRVDLKNLFIDPTVEHLSDYISTMEWMALGKETIAEDADEMTF